MTTPQEIILGSGSPRRHEILSFFKIPFLQVASEFDEDSVAFEGDPERYVIDIAKGKAEALRPKYPDHVVLTADTTVYLKSEVLGKPETDEEALKMLKKMSGRWHEVYTGVTVSKGSFEASDFEMTRVLMNDLTDLQLRSYIRRIGSTDRAGGYSVLSEGSLIVNRIEGCFYNPAGLPINPLTKLLSKAGVDLWNVDG